MTSSCVTIVKINPEIRKIADDLENQGIKPWLDEKDIRPGTSWQTALGEQIESITSAAVFVGKSGIGPWQNEEIQALLNQFTRRKCPVIPVVLPSATATPRLPWTLENRHWVDFRKTSPDPLKQLIWGITGKKLGNHTDDLTVNEQVIFHETETKDLLPSKEKQIIELRLPDNLQEYSQEKQVELFQALSNLLKVGEVKLTRVVAGSIRMYLEPQSRRCG